MSVLANILKDVINEMTAPSTFATDPIEGQEKKEEMMDMMNDETIINEIGEADFNDALAVIGEIGEGAFREAIGGLHLSSMSEPVAIELVGDDTATVAGGSDLKIEVSQMEPWLESKYTRTILWSANGGPDGVTFDPVDGVCTTVTYPEPGTYRIFVKMIYTADPNSLFAEDLELSQSILVTVT